MVLVLDLGVDVDCIVLVFALGLPFVGLFVSVAEEQKSRSLREEFSHILSFDVGVSFWCRCRFCSCHFSSGQII